MGDAAEKLPVAVDESEMNLLLDDAGVNIWIDKYSDVFSDFDTRPLIKRKLSNDFITEICKMVREDPTAQVELNFNILDDQKDAEVEGIIINHLTAHFTNNQKAEREVIRKVSRKGFMLTSLGFMLILVLAYVASIAKGIFFLNSLPVLVEPLAWFVTWTGLDHIFKNYGIDKSQDINTRMLQAKISFLCLGAPAIETEVVADVTPSHKPRKVIPAGNNLRIA
jgi:hypothetical protein